METERTLLKNKTLKDSDELLTWYKLSARRKKNFSKFIRAISIICVGVGGLCPLLNTTGIFGETDISKWGYIAFALAGIFIGYDKFFGVSSGWVRYTLAIFEIEKAIKDFEYDWAYLETSLQDADNPSMQESQEFITIGKRLTDQVALIEKDETEKWAAEFENSITELRKSAVSS